MPSCSNSSNIFSNLTSINVAQGSAGSRFLIEIDYVTGLTVGQVIRYDVPTSGYTASKADLPQNAEVIGIIESYNSSTNKFNVVLGGSINLDASKFIYIDGSGGAGGNDIYFLSGSTAGKLQNLAPSDVSHITKPIYQIAPHGNFTGTVINYSGYRLGGDVQAGLDTVNTISRIGSMQLVFENDLLSKTNTEQELLDWYGFGYPSYPQNQLPITQLNATQYYDWKLEYLNLDNRPYILRLIDFSEFCNDVMPILNNGWIERVKVNSSQTVSRNNLIGKAVRQPFHGGFYDNTTGTVNTQWYGVIIEYDATNRYLYIQRPPYPSEQLLDPTNRIIDGLLAETSPTSASAGKLKLCVSDNPNSSLTGTEILITETDTTLQLFAFVTPVIKLINSATEPNYPFQIFTDGGYDPLQTGYEMYSQMNNPANVYVRVKNKGLGVYVPDNLSVKNVTLTNSQPTVDLSAKLINLEARIAALEGV